MRSFEFPNLRLFFPMNAEVLDTLPCNMTMKFRLETNLKLNVIHTESGEPFVKEERRLMKPEVHFLTMEGNLGTVNTGSITDMVKDVRSFSNIDTEAPITNWTIVDFDNHLNGNPHI